MTGQLYTLGEAAAELARRQCAAEGHDWTLLVVTTMGDGDRPYSVDCARRCGVTSYTCTPRADG